MGSKEKKRSKKASQSRKKKRDQSSRKSSAKKLPRHEDSYSESDDDSLSSISSSSYSSEEGVVKGRRGRSHARKDVKGRKKRARSSSCGSDSGSDSVRVKKRKSSRRKVGLGRKKKNGKKYKRAGSLSSTSSDESDYDKSRDDSKKKRIRRRNDKEEKSKRKKNRVRVRSVSPSNESSASDIERKRKRYQSPSGSSSSASSKSEREGKRKRYWSPSGSSLSRGSKSSDEHIQDEIEVQNKPIRKLSSIIVVASSVEPDQNSMSKGLENDLDTRDNERSRKLSLFEKGEYIEEKQSATEAADLVPDNEDLESILRLKALENLKRFRGGLKTSEKSERKEMIVTGAIQLPNSENAVDQVNTGGSNMKHSLTSEIGPIQNESGKDQIVNVNMASSSEKEEVLVSPSVHTINTSIKNNVETKTGSTMSAQSIGDNGVVIRQKENLNSHTRADKRTNSSDGSVSGHNIISLPSRFSNVNARSDPLPVSQEPLAACSTKGLKSSPKECISPTLMPSKSSTDKSCNTQIDEVDPRNNIIKESSIVDATVPDNPSSSLPDTSASEHVSSEHQKENKEGSQFQEKTMSVMRGGELVQVSYKVYIPPRAPTANRRRLNR